MPPSPSEGLHDSPPSHPLRSVGALLAARSLPQLPLLRPEALVGRRVSKHFPGFGRFAGKVVAQGGELGYSVEYEDGDTEDLSQEDVLRLLQAPPKQPAKQPSKRARRTGATGPDTLT